MPDMTATMKRAILGPLQEVRDLLMRAADTDDPCAYEEAIGHIAEAIAILSVDPEDAVAAEREWIVLHLPPFVARLYDAYCDAVRADDYDPEEVERVLEGLTRQLVYASRRAPAEDLPNLARMVKQNVATLAQLRGLREESG